MKDYKKRLPAIKYTSRDFKSIRNDLIQHAQRYYPDTFKDWSEASFGSLMVDSVAYIGDILSFYLDYQVNESFIDTAVEVNNIIRHGRAMGYKYRGPAAAMGEVSFFVSVPASSTGMGIDTDYLPVIKRGTTVGSKTGGSYTLVDDIRFNDTTNPAVVSRVNESTGLPTHYAVKTKGRVISGFLKRKTVNVGSFKKFLKIKIGTSDVSEIISVTDSEGSRYFEVDYLSQDTIYKELVNKNVTNDDVPSIIKPFTVPRRFTTIRTRASTSMLFGNASAEERSPSIADPKNIVLDVFAKDYVSDRSFDPSRLLSTDKFGVAPADTKLTITYLTNGSVNSNAAVGSVDSVGTLLTFFEKSASLTKNKINDVKNTIEVHNELPIVGQTVPLTADEIKQNITDVFATQNRAVTKEDYQAIALAMPQKFGSVKRVNIVRDSDSLKRNLNMYILSENKQGRYIRANPTLKRNLKTWLGRYKMMTDTIDILDAKVANIGIEYKIVVMDGVDKFTALAAAQNKIMDIYNRRNYHIGEPFYISEIWSVLNRSAGVLDVKDVKIVAKTGIGYSKTSFNIVQNMSPDARYLVAPMNVALEIKFPITDIKGTVV